MSRHVHPKESSAIWSPHLSNRHFSLVPRPHPLTRKRVWWLLSDSWLCWVNSVDLGQSNEIVPCHPNIHINQWSRPCVMQNVINVRSKSILLSQHSQEIAQQLPDPFPCERAGSGHESMDIYACFLAKMAGLLFQDMCCTIQDMCCTNRITLSVVMWSQNFVFKHVVSRVLDHIISCL